MQRMNLTTAVLALFVSVLPAQVKASAQLRPRPPLEEPLPASLPTVMHFCALHCITLTLENGQFTNYTNLPGQHDEKRVFAVESFTRESFLIRRTDTGSNPWTTVYSGRMSADGNSVSGDGWQMAWGAALNTLAGSDEERDMAARQAAVTPCSPSSTAPAGVALQHGMQAMQANRAAIGICWLRIAAKQGDAKAQGALAATLYKGIGVPVNHTEAYAWAQKAAAQSNPVGELALSQMYTNGDGPPKDPEKADYWKAKAQRDQQAETRQQLASRKNPPDIWTMLNQKTPSGLTPLEILRSVIPSPEESELAQYKQDDHNCRTYQNHQACLDAANEKADLIAGGIDIQ